jgi:formylmethanofuran dehydrogenase subunit E
MKDITLVIPILIIIFAVFSGLSLCAVSEVRKEIRDLKKTITPTLEKIATNTANKENSLKPLNVRPQDKTEKQGYWGKCPNCGELVSNRNRYCDDCGQLIDWGDKEDK